jgi:hypothetical protein
MSIILFMLLIAGTTAVLLRVSSTVFATVLPLRTAEVLRIPSAVGLTVAFAIVIFTPFSRGLTNPLNIGLLVLVVALTTVYSASVAAIANRE